MFLLALALSACGDGLGPVTLSPDDAAEVYVEATLHPYLLAVPIVGSSVTATAVDKSDNCATSGTLAVTGDIKATGAVQLSAAFTACKVKRYQMAGTITIAGTLTATTASLNWHGTLVLDGPAQGECWVDVVLTVDPTAQTLTGTVCGADAAALPDAAKKAGLVG